MVWKSLDGLGRGRTMLLLLALEKTPDSVRDCLGEVLLLLLGEVEEEQEICCLKGIDAVLWITISDVELR